MASVSVTPLAKPKQSAKEKNHLSFYKPGCSLLAHVGTSLPCAGIISTDVGVSPSAWHGGTRSWGVCWAARTDGRNSRRMFAVSAGHLVEGVKWRARRKNLLSGEHRDSLVGEASLPPRALAAVLRTCGEHRPLRCSEKWRLRLWGRMARARGCKPTTGPWHAGTRLSRCPRLSTWGKRRSCSWPKPA